MPMRYGPCHKGFHDVVGYPFGNGTDCLRHTRDVFEGIERSKTMTSNPERPHTTDASLRRSTWSADVTSMKTKDSSEARLVRQICVVMRAVVILSWLSILIIWP